MTILRTAKNKENPYVILNKKFLEDPKISLKLKGFLAYCMSKPDDWVFHVEQMSKVLKEGRDSIYAIISEGVKHGYIEKSWQKLKGKFKSCDYVIHEEKIQNILTIREKPDTVFPDTEKPTLLSNDPVLSNDSKKKNNKKEHSAGATALAEFFLKKMIDRQPDYSNTITKKWLDSAERLLKLKSPDEIKRLIEFSLKDPFWSKVVTDLPTILRNLEKLVASMNAKATSAACAVDENKKYAQAIIAANPRHYQTDVIQIGNNYIEFKNGIHSEEIRFDSHGFKAQCKNILSKMGLRMPE